MFRHGPPRRLLPPRAVADVPSANDCSQSEAAVWPSDFKAVRPGRQQPFAATTSDFANPLNAASSNSTSRSSCLALRAMRSRAVPAGTVGGRIAGTYRLARSRPAIRTSAAALLPTTRGWIAVAETIGRQPAASIAVAGPLVVQAHRRGGRGRVCGGLLRHSRADRVRPSWGRVSRCGSR